MAGINLGPDHDLAIRLSDIESRLLALETQDILQNASIGKGGITVNGGTINVTSGGSIIVTGSGSIQLPTGTLSANHVNGTTDLNAPTLNVTNSNVSGNETISGTLYANGAVKMPQVYSTSITSAYRVVYNGNGDGSMGYNLSSARFKQDIADWHGDPAVFRALRVVAFRYISAVEQWGDAAAIEVGLIAEEVDALGLSWLVDYDDEGRPEGLKFDRLAVAALALAQHNADQLDRTERRSDQSQ